MWLIVMRGLPGCGKSTLSRALSKHLNWPLIDKDDVRDMLGDEIPGIGGLAYEIMFNVARRQLLQGLNVICDSPLVARVSYDRAKAIANETQAYLAVIECACSDESLWRSRITERKTQGLPTHHQTDWDSFQEYRRFYLSQANYALLRPHLVVDTAKPLHDCFAEILAWLEQASASAQSSLEKCNHFVL